MEKFVVTDEAAWVLRKKTGYGLSMCKRALMETRGDEAAAVEYIESYVRRNCV
jgi:translation elongation factor EF-Ts